MSSSDTVKPLPTALAKDAYVASVTITAVPANVSPEFRDKLISSLQQHLQRCAHGKQALNLQVAIALFAPQNPAVTILVGDSNKIKGTAQLIDPTTNAVVGDYDIARSIGWGGIAAAVAMAPAEAEMVDGFASEVCNRAFPG